MTDETHDDMASDDVRERVEKKVAAKNNSFLDFVKDADPEALERFMPTEPVRRAQPKVGRNDPCPCGSGKKYKKCCGK
jgi:uncharacterized protein YecA (UPF0149 family)